tara:strand:+ start:9645 stop:11477 length:1833 start_codon:yes stop_codon:yes gene_type:complete
MKKTILSTVLFIFFLLFIATSFLTFFGYETDKFNQVIKSEIKKNNKNIDLNFEKISILLDLKKLILFVKFINPTIDYHEVSFPLRSLRTDIDLEFLIKKKIVIKKVILSTKYLEFNKIKYLPDKIGINRENLKNIKSARFQIKDLILEFNEDFKLKQNLSVGGDINSAVIKLTDEYEVKNLKANFLFEKNSFKLNKMSWNLSETLKTEKEFFNGDMSIIETRKNYNIDLNFQTQNSQNFPKISPINYSLVKNNDIKVKTKFSINKNKKILFKSILIEDKNNTFQLKNLNFDKKFNLINFGDVKVKTSMDDKVNNEFLITNTDKIRIKGNIFDAKMIIKELSKDNKNNKFLKRVSKDIEIDFKKIIKGTNFPIKNFRLIGKINKGSFEKITAKSDFSNNEHLDISLKKMKKEDLKILEIYSDIALPLLSDYKFFQGLDGGNLNYISRFNNESSSSILIVKDFKLNKAPALAKLLSLADLKGLTDSLKGEGISFDTLSIKYTSNSTKIDIEEIFMIGPSISILIDGYVEKKSALVSLRGTLVPAKTLNNLISKIPVVGEILIGKKIGEGIFGISFKMKGLPDNLKTTVNPVKTLTPRFITRALEEMKEKKSK